MSAGKVELGAFRTYPKGYKPPDEVPSEYQSIPLNKVEDFGVHCKQVLLHRIQFSLLVCLKIVLSLDVSLKFLDSVF